MRLLALSSAPDQRPVETAVVKGFVILAIQTEINDSLHQQIRKLQKHDAIQLNNFIITKVNRERIGWRWNPMPRSPLKNQSKGLRPSDRNMAVATGIHVLPLPITSLIQTWSV